jgi:uncharacterized delta-60 repeat protein
MRGVVGVGLRLRSGRLALFASVMVVALLANVAGAVNGGRLDATFGSGGTRVVDVGGTEAGFGLAVQPDGKLVLVGGQQPSSPGEAAKAIVVRLTPEGSLDPTFGSGGVVMVPCAAGFAVALQTDGKIVVGGAICGPGLAVIRLLSDGRLDTSFGTAGRASADVGGYGTTFALAMQPDGKIFAVGRASAPSSFDPGDFAVARFNSDGSLDSSFAGNGRVRTDFGGGEDAMDVALQPDGKVVVVGGPGIYGAPWAVARYNPNGSLDPSFDGDGKIVTDFGGGAQGAFGVALQPDGKIVVAGWRGEQGGPANRGVAVARYLPDGSLDASFSGDGRAVEQIANSDTGRDVVLQPNGKIVVAGQTGGDPDFMLTRFLPDGRVDRSFGNGTGFLEIDFGGHDYAWRVAIDAEGRILGAGASHAEATAGDMTVGRVLIGECLVPRLTRLMLHDARGELEAAGCRLGTVRRVKSKRVKRGRVVSQSPRPGTRLEDFAAVDVILSRGLR